jgi:hypothetical protein
MEAGGRRQGSREQGEQLTINNQRAKSHLSRLVWDEQTNPKYYTLPVN